MIKLVIALDFETHLQPLEEVLKRLKQAELKLGLFKCKLLQSEVRYLGHIVSATGVATDPEKVAGTGTVGYYRRYVSGFVSIAQPLHRLTS